MKRLILMGLAAVLAVLLIAGCGDDDECPACPTFEQLGTMLARAGIIGDTIEFGGQLIGVDNKMLQLDSVTLDGYQADIYPLANGMMGYWFEVLRSAALTGYQSGDTADIRIYTPHDVCTCEPVLLNVMADVPFVLDWSMNYPDCDTVDIATEITVDWHTVGNADWYVFYTLYMYDSLGITNVESDYFVGTTDTTITRPGSAIAYNGLLYIKVIAMTGPMFDATTGNVSCEIVGGSIHSMAVHEGFYIAVGTGGTSRGSLAGHDPLKELTLDKLLRRLRR
ncbi:MAG: hypothetical protein ABII79_04605 [bacterium]